MNMNFDKTDRLISLIEDSVNAIKPHHFISAYNLKIFNRNFYDELVEITASDDTDDVKDEYRLKAFAKKYHYDYAMCDKDFLKTEFLRFTFDENKVLSNLTKAYWQIQTRKKITDNISFVLYEPYDQIAAEAVKNQEPTIEDIEREFWSNCPEIDKMNNLLNIYRERWYGHFYECDLEYYSECDIHTKKNELGEYLEEIRLCGLLRNDCLPEMLLCGIAQEINSLCESIIKLLQMMRKSTEPTIKEPISMIDQGTLKVQTVEMQQTPDNEKVGIARYKFIIDKEKESVILKIYEFWQNCEQSKEGYANVFKDITRQQFLEMVTTADFSQIYIKPAIRQRVGYNVVLLSKIIKSDEWTNEAEKNLNTTITKLKKNTQFAEYGSLKTTFPYLFPRRCREMP